jgi:putative addiction module killer protein
MEPEPIGVISSKFTLEPSTVFDAWFGGFRDRFTRSRITGRLWRAADGNFGKVRSVGEGVFEMQLDFGPGYRIYYFQMEPTVYRLLCGGDKDSQVEDVKLAKMLKREAEREHGMR